jgi:methylated-DNA-[protein]-cysteine S-methyltransferase
MGKTLRYAIFRTRWGWFGFCGHGHGLIRTCLPMKNPEMIRRTLLSGLDATYKDPGYFKSVQEDINRYYKGTCVDFKSVPVCLDGLTAFQKTVLLKLKGIKYGKIITYRNLARMAGNPRSVRAIGQVMAKNPLPLIIPCHRVVRSDGSLGGFSAYGGIETKKKMLNLENSLEPREQI